MNPMLLDLPNKIITPRLILSPPRPGDGAEICAAINSSLKELRPWLPFAQVETTIQDCELNVRRSNAQWILREDLRMSIFEKASGKLVGSTGLHRINWDVPCFEIGYWAVTSFTGQGFIKESTNALTRFCFEYLKAKRVELRCDSDNAPSLAIMKSLGFDFEGLLRQNALKADKSIAKDTLVYARLNTLGLPALEVSWS
jgi:RimJ/RimL family protein N-acetyltransferase